MTQHFSESQNTHYDTQSGNTNGTIENLEAKLPELAKKMIEGAQSLPALFESELKENPYRLLGIVGGVSLGVGMLIGSRVMRTIALSVGGYALTETLRNYVGDAIRTQVADGTQTAQH